MVRARMGNLIVRLHLRLRCIVVAFFMVSIALLWFVRMQSCRSYIETWTGMLPVQARAGSQQPLQPFASGHVHS